MNKAAMKRTLIAGLLSLYVAGSAAAGDWEVNILASVSGQVGVKNRISLGQRADATDVWDGQYDVPARVEGPIAAYFPHFDWIINRNAYWRDIRGPGMEKSWLFNVESLFSGATIILKWDSGRVPAGYTATLVDTSTGATMDMTAQDSYSYTHSGPRQFTVNTVEPVQVEFLEAPTGLTGFFADGAVTLGWTDNSALEAGFIIERKDGGGGYWIEIGQAEANAVAYIDDTVDYTIENIYFYRVKAVYGTVESDYSKSSGPVKDRR